MEWFSPKVAAWPVEFDEQTKAQAFRLARLPIVPSHLALMPDAHLGKGATVGSVLLTSAPSYRPRSVSILAAA